VAGIGPSLKGDHEFTPEEEAEALKSNRFMCVAQMGISALQLTTCAILFNRAPVRDAVNIAVCAVSLPLAAAGFSALLQPEAEYSVSIMRVYQYFFVLRAGLVTFDYAAMLHTRKRDDTSERKVVIGSIALVAILTLQVLNSLLVLAVIRIMRKMRRDSLREQASAGGQPGEATPLLA
jgi:hypothetical protein